MLSGCAERVAVFKALSEGLAGFDAIVVAADSKRITAPCGPCRQILWEFCGDLLVHMVNLRGETFRALKADAGEDWAKSHDFH